MAILITEKNRIIIQGITGQEGSRAAEEMVTYHQTHLVGGIRPGKGGEFVHGVPVYNTIAEAREQQAIDTSMIYVPPAGVLSAVREALQNDIKLIIIITENVPVRDVALIYQEARRKGTLVIGPSSVGAVSPEIAKLGCIGAVKKRIFTKGDIGIISKSGGLCAETALLFTKNGLGQSTVIGIGGDYLSCSSFYELIQLFEQDEQTAGIVMIGELGGVYEEQIVQLKNRGLLTKPVVAFIGGRFTEQLQTGNRFGHTGALIEGNHGRPSEKTRILEENGIPVARYHDQLVNLMKEELGKVVVSVS